VAPAQPCGYFLIGFLLACAVIGLCLGFTKLRPEGCRRSQPGPFGGSSLLSIALGNVLLCLMSPWLGTRSAGASVVIAASLVVVFYAGMVVLRWQLDAMAASRRSRSAIPRRNQGSDGRAGG
jgi:hypothetical protein